MKDLPRKLRLLQEGVASIAADYIESLEEAVEHLGEMSNTCTYNDINRICSSCRCFRQREKKDG